MMSSRFVIAVRIIFSAWCLVAAAACNAGYGPREDHSEFKSAKLAEDGDTVLFSYHRFLYRPASGFRAFPDGGIPKYETDINYLGIFNRKTGKVKILRREENRHWQPGQGNFTIQDVNGPFALVAQGGQVRGPFELDIRHLLVNWKQDRITDLDLEADLATLDRDPYHIYLAAPDGTLVLITSSVQEGKTPNIHRQSGFVSEIWARTAGGDYLEVAASNHYEKVENGEVIYWDPDTRDFLAFSLSDRTTRVLPDYRHPPYRDVTEGVSLSRDKQQIEYGKKTGGQWSYTALTVKPADFR